MLRAASVSLLLGVVLTLSAGSFVAKASSPVTAATSSKTTTSSPRKKPVATVKAAKVTPPLNSTDKHTPPACSKAQMLTLLPLPLNAPGLIESHEAPAHYDIYGRTIAEAKDQLHRCAPGTYFAYTSSRLNWKYEFALTSSGSCVITDVRVGIRTKIQYPRWMGAHQATLANQQTWQRMMNNLAAHEAGHVQRSSAVANQMYAALKNMPVTSCDVIAAKAQTIVASYNNKLKQTHTEYDHQTNHGQTQNAVL